MYTISFKHLRIYYMSTHTTCVMILTLFINNANLNEIGANCYMWRDKVLEDSEPNFISVRPLH